MVSLQFSCKQENKSEWIEETCDIIRRHNNVNLLSLRQENIQLKYIKESSIPYAEKRLGIIQELLNLNDKSKYNSAKLSEIFRKTYKICELKERPKMKSSQIEYLLSIQDLIKAGCLSTGPTSALVVPRQYSINNSKFVANKGDTVKIPIKVFPRIIYDINEFVLFDTLNFRVKTDNQGYFETPTNKLKIGENNIRNILYVKSLLTGETINLDIVDAEVSVE